MSLIQQLAAALNDAIGDIDNRELGDHVSPNVDHWRELVKKVQDLDSSLYLPHKCHMAGCEGSEHVCGQGKPVDVIVAHAVEELRAWAADCNPVEADQIILTAIKQALGDIDISEERKIIMKRLDDLQSAFKHFEVMASAVPRYTTQDLHWLVAVTRRTLQLYAREAYNSFCHIHNQQQGYCEHCLAMLHERSYRRIAEALHKVLDKPMLQAVAAAVSGEQGFEAMLLNEPVASRPTEGGF